MQSHLYTPAQIRRQYCYIYMFVAGFSRRNKGVNRMYRINGLAYICWDCSRSEEAARIVCVLCDKYVIFVWNCDLLFNDHMCYCSGWGTIDGLLNAARFMARSLDRKMAKRFGPIFSQTYTYPKYYDTISPTEN